MNWRQRWRKRMRGIHNFRRLPRGLKKIQLLRTAALGFLVAVIAGTLVTAVLFSWYARELPSPDKIVRREGFATKILDREGNLLYDVFGEQQRTPIELKDIPEHLK